MKPGSRWFFPLFVALPMLCACPPSPPGNGNGNANDNGGGNGGAGDTGILLAEVPGAESELLDVYVSTSTQPLERGKSTGEVIELAPGTYDVTQYFNRDFVYAADLVVVAGAVTRVQLGALEVTTPAGSVPLQYDLFDAAGSRLLSRPNETNMALSFPGGTYLLREYFNNDFVFARDVVVSAGQTTTIGFGGIELRSADNSGDVSYDLYDASGTMRLVQAYSSDEIRAVPAGTYVVREYFNADFTYATLVVQSGRVTEFTMGAIRYNGAEPNYDIYDESGQVLLARPGSRGEIRAVPPGTYVLKDYFSDVVLADDVVVAGGRITDVP